MNIHEITCTNCGEQAKASVYELIGKGWQIKDGIARCEKCREKYG